MKALLLLPLLVFMTTLTAEDAEKSSVVLNASLGVGVLSYEERATITPVVSEWNSAEGVLSLDGVILYEDLQPYASFRYSSSAKNEEEWRENGFLVQENDLEVTSSEIRAGVQFPFRKEKGFTITPRVGALYSEDEYTRDNFFFLVQGATLFNVNQQVVETVRTAGPTAGVVIEVQISDSLRFELDAEIAWLGVAEAENDGFDVTIEANEGWEYAARLSLFKDLKREGTTLGVGLKVDRKEIDGAVISAPDSTIEYPDNTLDRVSVEFVWSTTF